MGYTLYEDKKTKDTEDIMTSASIVGSTGLVVCLFFSLFLIFPRASRLSPKY